MKRTFEQVISTAEPQSFAKVALMFGILGLGLGAISLLKSPIAASTSQWQQVDHKFTQFAGCFQLTFGAGFGVGGGGLYLRKGWGRRCLQIVLWSYMAATVASLPFVLYLWHLMLSLGPGAGIGSQSMRVMLFIVMMVIAILVLIVMFRSMLLAIRELNSPRFKGWTSPLP